MPETCLRRACSLPYDTLTVCRQSAAPAVTWCRETHIPRDVLSEYIEELKKIFTPEAYNLFHHNCNNFSNELATFLTGSGIPV